MLAPPAAPVESWCPDIGVAGVCNRSSSTVHGAMSPGPVRDIANPATLAVLGTAADCGPDDIARAVGAATRALPAWSALGEAPRATLLTQVGALVREGRRDISRLLSSETGKPLCEAQDW